MRKTWRQESAFIAAIVLWASQALCAQAQPQTKTTIPSLTEFFQNLVQRYDPKSLPTTSELLQVTRPVSKADTREITKALPWISDAIHHQDETVEADGAYALLAISYRSDATDLLNGQHEVFDRLLNTGPARFQLGTITILSNLRTGPTSPLFPELLKFVKQTDRDPQAQVQGVFVLAKYSPNDTEALSTIRAFASRPQASTIRETLAHGLAMTASDNPSIQPMLLSLVHDPDASVRFTVIQALSGDALKKALPELEKIAADPNEESRVKEVARQAIARNNGPK